MEEADSKVRRTRSAKVKSTPPPKVTKAAKNSPKVDGKPTTRRTRKKVVLMEVEVSDEEDETPVENSGDEKSEITESELEDKLLASPEASNDASDIKADEKADVNGDNDVSKEKSEEKNNLDDSITVVFNDIEMIETDDGEQVLKPKESTQKAEPEVTEPVKDKKDPTPTDEPKKSTEKSEPATKVEELPKKAETVEEKKSDVPEKTELVAKVSSEKTTESKETENLEEKKPATLVIAIEKTQETEEKIVVEKEKEDEKMDVDEEKKPEITKPKEDIVEKMEVDDDDVMIVEKKEVKSEQKVVEKKEVANEKMDSEQKDQQEAKQKQEEDKVEKTKEKIEEAEVKTEEVKGKVEKTEEKNVDSKEQTVDGKEKTEENKVEIKDTKEKVEVAKKKTEEAKTKTEETKEKTEEAKEKKEEAKEKKEEAKEKTEEAKEKTEEAKEKIEEVKEKTEEAKEKIEEPKEKAEPAKESKEVVEEKEADKEIKEESTAEKKGEESTSTNQKQNGDPDAENISEDELPGVPVVKVPEAEEVSDEELPGPKRAELPADTEVVSEDELPTVKSDTKKEGVKRKINETDDYDPGSPTSESEAPAKKPSLEKEATEKEEKPKPKKLPELDKYWKAVNDDPTDFTGWTYLLQYVDQENDMEAAREAYDAFLSHYPYCYGYWRKYADYEKRKGNKKKCEEVFERGLKAIPLSVDLWIHYLTYVKTTRTEEEDFIRSQFDRALAACGLEFRSDRLWDSYIKWETEGKRLQKVTAIYDKLLATPTQGYTTHFDNFQEHVATNPPNKVIDVDEFLALRKEVRNLLKHDTPPEPADSDAPPGDDDQTKVISSDEETKSIRERIVSIRRKIHKSTVNAVTARWNYEEGIKRPYFHVKPLERCQLKNWHDYLDYETEQGDRVRIIVLFERCLIACALYEEFWMKFVHYLENLKDAELQPKIRDVYERACTIHHLKKPNLHLQWAMFEENVNNAARAAEILVNLEKTVPNVLQIAYRRINLERRRVDHEKCAQLYEHYINSSKNKMISSNIAIKYSRFCFRILKDIAKAQEVLKTAITKDPNNPRLYLQLIDLTLQKEEVTEKEVIEIIDSFLEKESTDIDQKTLFAQRKLEYLEDFGSEIQTVQVAYENYQKLLKLSKENNKKKEIKSDTASSSVAKKEKPATPSSSQASSYGNYGQYGANPSQPPYAYSGQQGQYNYSQYGQNEQYQYQNWQYPQGGYSGYNQWGGYSGGYGY